MPAITNTMQWDVVNVTLGKGVDLNTRRRVIPADTLEIADNVYFAKNGGLEKRRGYKQFELYDASMTLTANPPSDNLYGHGLFDAEGDYTSDYSQCGNIKDILVHNDGELAWDGWRFYKPISASTGKCAVIDAFIPTVKTFQTANTVAAQEYVDSAETSQIRVVSYISGGVAYAKVYDLRSGLLKFTAEFTECTTPKFTRAINTSNFVHVLVSDGNDKIVRCYSINDNDTSTPVPVEVVTTSSAGVFDVHKYDEQRFLVGGVDGAGNLRLSWIAYNGIVLDDYFSTDTTIVTSNDVVSALSFAVHPTTLQIAVAYSNGTSFLLEIYDSYLNSLVSVTPSSTDGANTIHSAVVPSYLNNSFTLFVDEVATDIYVDSYTIVDGVETAHTKRYNVVLASKGIRVGNVPFVWTVSATPIQKTYVLMNSDLLPVGRVEYGTARYSASNYWLPSVNYISGNRQWNVTRFNGAIMYKERIDNETRGDGTNFNQAAIKVYDLNFLPDKLSAASAGKCLYIAGAQLWSFDGDTLKEANFGEGVEVYDISSSAGTGSLVPGNKYRWRVDMCYRNAQNEECRACSYISEEYEIPASHNTVTLKWTQPVTGRLDAYFKVYRNENNGTVWYLVSDVDSPVAYNPGNSQASFDDITADADILDNEPHPANALNYIQPIAAPACELVTFGKDRLWISGGELLPGEVWPSRLFYPGQTPAFSWALAFFVDKTSEPITGLAFQTDYGVVFKQSSTYLVTGDVMPNILNPAIYPSVQLAIADRGCVNSKSITRLTTGITFQSVNGYKLINPAGQLQDIGFPVESVHHTCVGAMSVSRDEHVRFYSSDERTLVYDFRRNQWSTFTFNTKPSAAVLSSRTGLAVIARGRKLLYETIDYYLDGDFTFHYTVKTAPLAAKIGGFQRVRRVYCNGEHEGVPPACTIRVYLNGHDWWSEQLRWKYADDLNTDTFGSGNFGEGLMGDNVTDEFRDDIWKFRKRISEGHQKCENIAIEITDKGSIVSPDSKWVPVAFGLEIGTKNGVDRLAGRTFTNQ